MKRILCCLLAFFLCKQSNAQYDRCGTVIYLKQLMEKDPQLESRLKVAEEMRQQRFDNSDRVMDSITIVIPVVFHVVYYKAAQNVTNERLLEQIDVLNNDYARLNQDAQSTPSGFQSIASSVKIQFCLAKRDPANKPTTGIERRQTTVETFDFDNVTSYATGGLDSWNNSKYLNVWLCNLSGNLLGFGTLPGTAPASKDGVVVSYATIGGPDAVGSHPVYNLGRTLSHEVGHYFNLIHVWGDDAGACTGSDNVADTPNQADEHYGFPAYPFISCNNGPNGDMFMNFLDYSDDLAMNSFSAGQAARMEDALDVNRASLKSSNGCTPPAAIAVDAAIVKTLNASGVFCQNQITPSVIIKNSGTSTLTSAIVKFAADDSSIQQISWTGSLAAGNTDTLSLDTILTSGGIHTFTVTLTVTGDGNTSNNIYVTSFSTIPNAIALPYTQDFENKRFPNDSCTIYNSTNDAGTWMRSRMASTASNSSMWIYAPETTPAGTFDDITLEPMNFTTIAEPVMAFDVAYAHNPALAGIHELKILASVDCGETFTEVYSKSGSTLSTSSSTSLPFIPSASDWRKDTLSLSGLGIFDNVILKFRSVAGNANGLYIDNINIARFSDIFPDASAINFLQLGSINDGVLHFIVKLLKDKSCTISVYNLLGQKIINESYSQSTIEYPSNNEGKYIPYLRTGVYIVQVVTPSEKKSFKLFLKAR